MTNPFDPKENLVDIPPIFYSEREGDKFCECLTCKKNLLQRNVYYVIEKVIKPYPDFNTHETVFEYAMCLECLERFKHYISQASKEKMENYFRRHVVKTSKETHKELALDYCSIYGTPIHELEEYQISGFFIGEHLSLLQKPIVLGIRVLEEMSELLSEQTREDMDDFIDTYLGIPTEVKELLKEKKTIFI